MQIIDTHSGFNIEANLDVAGTLKQTIEPVNGMLDKPSMIQLC